MSTFNIPVVPSIILVCIFSVSFSKVRGKKAVFSRENKGYGACMGCMEEHIGKNKTE
jgi:hypothetical protein